MKKEVLKNWLILKRFMCLTFPQLYKRMETLKSWAKLAVIIVCSIAALVLLMAEPNKPYTGLSWFGVLVATKIGALACGLVAYVQLEKLTEEVKK